MKRKRPPLAVSDPHTPRGDASVASRRLRNVIATGAVNRRTRAGLLRW
jgi:hypothetical protein